MDPNAALAELRRLIITARQRAEVMGSDAVGDGEDIDRMSELFEGLDEWLSRGGFLPLDWTQPAPLFGLTATPMRDDVKPSNMGSRINPEPMPREEFDALIDRRRGLQHQVRGLDAAITIARARGVVPVTVETLNTNQTMSLGLMAQRERRHYLSAAVEAWHEKRDTAARDVIIEFLNAEARPQ